MYVLILCETANPFPKVDALFYIFSSSVLELPADSPKFDVGLPHFSHSNGYIALVHWGFNMYFSDD